MRTSSADTISALIDLIEKVPLAGSILATLPKHPVGPRAEKRTPFYVSVYQLVDAALEDGFHADGDLVESVIAQLRVVVKLNMKRGQATQDTPKYSWSPTPQELAIVESWHYGRIMKVGAQ